MKLVFMGSPRFSVPVLEALHAAGHQISCVYSQPPRPSGRGQKLTPTPVESAARALGLPVRTPLSFKGEDERAAFAALGADAAIVVAYGLILPRAVLEAPRLGCLNLHASLLPRWRGAAPIQRAILAGDAETGVQVMGMETGLDTGPVYATARTPIGPEDTGTSVHDRLSALAATLIVDTLPAIADGTLAPVPQSDLGVGEAGITYAAKIDRAETRIDWTRPAADIDRTIRAFALTPGAWCMAPDGKRLKLLGSRLCAPGNAAAGAPPGTVLTACPAIACGDGDAVELLRLQREGRPALDSTDFQRSGQPLETGTVLS
jgi:methionyl-tRNA formyltransferase